MPAPYFQGGQFQYDRLLPPMFFTADGSDALKNNTLVYNRISREYFRLGSRKDTTHETVMSNGMTLGEYAMMICVERNVKRKRAEGDDQ